MSACKLCGLEGGRPLFLTNGIDLGPAHAECSGLVWQAHADVVFNLPDDERAFTAWQWRQQMAKMRGLPFHEPLPKSRSERLIDLIEIQQLLGETP